MFDNLAALVALAESRTMLKAAHRLHVTQSAVSKRLANLEHAAGRALIVRQGRYVALTPEGLALLERARPLIADVRALFSEVSMESRGELVIDCAGSILIAWGAEIIASACKKVRGLQLRLGAFHASLAVERVRAGESMVALVQGRGEIAPDLMSHLVGYQSMVLVPSGLKTFSLESHPLPIEAMSIERHAEASRFIDRGIRELHSKFGIKIEQSVRVQSFSAIVQMARAGLGHGIVPQSVARTLGVPSKRFIMFPAEGLRVPVSLVARKSTWNHPAVRAFYAAFSDSLPASL